MKVPDDWKKAVTVKVLKKGDVTKCSNFREPPYSLHQVRFPVEWSLNISKKALTQS